MKITPKNWRDFQHYKDRNPPWIRLHKGLLDNFEFQSLPVASRALAPMLWLLASDSVDGLIDAEPKKLAFRLRMSLAEVVEALKPLIDNGFFIVEQDASKPLADGLHCAVPEAEAETEAFTETEAAPKPPRPSKRCPESFEITQDLMDWAAHEMPGVDWVAETKRFRDHTFPKALTDWPATWRNWIRRSVAFAPKGAPMSFRERDAAIAAARVHEMTGGLVSAKPPRRDALQEVFDATPRLVG